MKKKRLLWLGLVMLIVLPLWKACEVSAGSTVGDPTDKNKLPYGYKNDAHITKASYYDKDGKLWRIISYTYEGNTIKTSTKEVGDDWNHYGEWDISEYEFNERGDVVRISGSYKSYLGAAHDTACMLLEDGREIYCAYRIFTTEEQWEYTYDEHGNVLKEKFLPSEYLTIYYNNSGKEVYRKTDYFDGSEYEPEPEPRDDEGRLLVGDVSTTYDGERLIEYKDNWFLDDGEERRDYIAKTTFEYNDKGYLIKQSSYRDEELYEYQEFEYDQYGNLAKQLYYDVDGKLYRYDVYESDNKTIIPGIGVETAATPAPTATPAPAVTPAPIPVQTPAPASTETNYAIGTPVIKMVEKSGNDIILHWDKVSSIDGYVLYRSTDNKNFELYKKISDSSKTTYRDQNAAKESKCYYRIAAYKGNVNSQSPVSSTYMIDIKKINAKFSTKFISLEKKKHSKNKVTLHWKKKSGAAGYLIYRKEGKGSYQLKYTVKNKDKEYINDVNLKKGVKYSYYIVPFKEVNSNGMKIKYMGGKSRKRTIRL